MGREQSLETGLEFEVLIMVVDESNLLAFVVMPAASHIHNSVSFRSLVHVVRQSLHIFLHRGILVGEKFCPLLGCFVRQRVHCRNYYILHGCNNELHHLLHLAGARSLAYSTNMAGWFSKLCHVGGHHVCIQKHGHNK